MSKILAAQTEAEIQRAIQEDIPKDPSQIRIRCIDERYLNIIMKLLKEEEQRNRATGGVSATA